MPSQEADAPRLRLRMFGVVAISLFAVLFARLWYLQVLNTSDLAAVAASNITRTVHVQAPRGQILDREGRVLVDNRVTTAVVADRRELSAAFPDADDRRAMLTRLAVEINRSGQLVKLADLEAELTDEKYGPFDEVVFALDVDPSLMVIIAERADEFPGVSVEQTTVRSYPYGEAAAHVLGYIGKIQPEQLDLRNARWDPDDPEAKVYDPSDDIGLAGVESLFEDELRGVPGQRVYEVDARGNIIRERLEERREPVQGNNIVLTLDIDLQMLVEDELERSLIEARQQSPAPDDPPFNAPAGASVVLDPRTGEVLAMASYPTFDPEEFVGGISTAEFELLNSEEAFKPLLNRVIQGEYPPASTFKLFTSYAAMETGLLDELYDNGWETYYQHGPVYRLQSCVEDNDTCDFRNSEDREYSVNLPRALTESSDSYYYRLGESFFIRPDYPDDAIQQAGRLFGLGERTGVALPFERPGAILDAEGFEARHDENPDAFPRGNWLPGDNVNLAIGQGEVLVTPLQLANAYAAFANGGTVYSPNVALEVTDGDGGTLREFMPRVTSTFELPDEIRDPIMEGLLGVTFDGNFPGGTGFSAFNLPGEGGVDFPLSVWPVAGKTGTAEIDGKADFAWFAGFGPVEYPEVGAFGREPAYVMVTLLEEAGFASRTATFNVARVLDRVATDSVPPAATSDELAECYEAAEAGLLEPPEADPSATDPASPAAEDATGPSTTDPAAADDPASTSSTGTSSLPDETVPEVCYELEEFVTP